MFSETFEPEVLYLFGVSLELLLVLASVWELNNNRTSV